MERFRAESAGFAESEEDVLSYAMFPAIAKEFFAFRKARNCGADEAFLTTVDGKKSYPV